eukprot:TRINITY_DN9355_c0_g1_i1.p1 TRINITY_DN9355_c0_g1~~TRINITY_DN9355_c0_g1_i1.p1  ORF type:complete len:138 (+),score=11.97 TRINITY_DN9355_c0_g1_i1:1-414(+)
MVVYLVSEERENWNIKLFSSIQICQLNGEMNFYDFSTTLFQEANTSCCSTSRGQQIIKHNNTASFRDRSHLNLTSVLRIFSTIVNTLDLSRQLVGFTNRHKRDVKCVSKRDPPIVTSGFKPNNTIDILIKIFKTVQS